MIIAKPDITIKLFAFIPTWTPEGLVWMEWVDLTIDTHTLAIFHRSGT